jgi:hypothetical protein
VVLPSELMPVLSFYVRRSEALEAAGLRCGVAAEGGRRPSVRTLWSQLAPISEYRDVCNKAHTSWPEAATAPPGRRAATHRASRAAPRASPAAPRHRRAAAPPPAPAPRPRRSRGRAASRPRAHGAGHASSSASRHPQRARASSVSEIASWMAASAAGCMREDAARTSARASRSRQCREVPRRRAGTIFEAASRSASDGTRAATDGSAGPLRLRLCCCLLSGSSFKGVVAGCCRSRARPGSVEAAAGSARRSGGPGQGC